MAKVLVVIAKNGFRDAEYFIPREILEKAGHNITTASNVKTGEIAIGVDGGKAKIDLNLAETKAADFDAVIFVGGPGALENLDNKESYRLAKEILRQAQDKHKILAAICVAPAILAKAGVLAGKKATVWSSVSDKSGIETLKNNGAEYIDKDVVEDGHIITGNGPQAAKEFGKKIFDNLRKWAILNKAQ